MIRESGGMQRTATAEASKAGSGGESVRALDGYSLDESWAVSNRLNLEGAANGRPRQCGRSHSLMHDLSGIGRLSSLAVSPVQWPLRPTELAVDQQ